MKTALIVNPFSANGKTGKNWPKIEAAIEARLGPCTTYMSEWRFHAPVLVKNAVMGGAQRLIAVGGDGTLHEVVNGVMMLPGNLQKCLAVGLIARGTGGDFRKTFGMGIGLEEQLDVLASNHQTAIDVGQADFLDDNGEEARRFFINICSFGMSGAVDRAVNDSSIGKWVGGKAAYFLASAGATLKWRNKGVTLTYADGRTESSMTNIIALCNGRYFGGGMYMAPMADPSDGLLDMINLGDMKLKDFLRHSRKIYDGTHLDLPQVQHLPINGLTAAPARAGEIIPLDIDGEAPGHLPARFSLHHKALTLITPPTGLET